MLVPLRHWAAAAVALSALLCSTPRAHADVPRTVAFQGALKDAAGKPIASTRSVTFALYDVASAGSSVWSETKDITPDAAGLFATALGDSTALTSVTFDKPYWVGIKVGADDEMTPRIPLRSVPYALALPGYTVDSGGGVLLQTPGLRVSLAPIGGGQLHIGSDSNDNRIYLEGFSSDGTKSADEILITGRMVASLPQLTVRAVKATFTGDLSVYGAASARTFTQTSSRRFKRNVQPIQNALGLLSQLQGVTYDWDASHGGQPDLGFIAEDVGRVLPQLVAWEPNGRDAMGMDYSHLVALAVEGIKAQQQEIADLKAENAAKDARLAEQGKQIANLAARLERLEAAMGER